MQEKWEAWKEIMDETISMSKREFWLMTAVGVLGGILFGILISPKKSLVIGRNNGNNSGNCGNGMPDEEAGDGNGDGNINVDVDGTASDDMNE